MPASMPSCVGADDSADSRDMPPICSCLCAVQVRMEISTEARVACGKGATCCVLSAVDAVGAPATLHSIGRQTLGAWITLDTGGPSKVAGVPDESAATVNVGRRTLEVAALMELQSAAVATTAPRQRSRYTYRSWGPNRRGELMEADTLRDVRPPSALSSSPSFPLSPLPFLPSPW